MGLLTRRKKKPTAAQRRALARRRRAEEARRRALAKKRAATQPGPTAKPSPSPPKPPAPVAAPAPATKLDPAPLPTSPAPAPDPAPKQVEAPAPAPLPAPDPVPAPPAPALAVYDGSFGRREAERLLWRAGFGPKPGEGEALAALGLVEAVRSLTRPVGPATLEGPEPTDDGQPIAPDDAWGHDLMFWLDRMVRSDQPLVERLALVFHDWFATSNSGVGSQRLMLEQIELFRTHGLGDFRTLTLEVTRNPAMLLWLNGTSNRRGAPDENYARELMELFTLGADRGAYTETDVRELARSLTGWRHSWSAELGDHDFRFDSRRWDSGNKTVFGHRGAWTWTDAVNLCIDHPQHASFYVGKLWSAFVPTAPSEGTRAGLEALYLSSGRSTAAVVEAILLHPDLYAGEPMVKAPMVQLAGLMRAAGRYVDSNDWGWLLRATGQLVLQPPNVAGWDERRWLDTSTLRGRWNLVGAVLSDRYVHWNAYTTTTETPEQAVELALAFWGSPRISPETYQALLTFATDALADATAQWQRLQYRALRQNALRHLIAASPDLLVS